MDYARKLQLFAAQVRLLTDMPMSAGERLKLSAVMHGMVDEAQDEAIAAQKTIEEVRRGKLV